MTRTGDVIIGAAPIRGESGQSGSAIAAKQQVEDASLLLAHGAASGASITAAVAAPIVEMQHRLARDEEVDAKDWTAFTLAYARLAGTMGKVTAKTLRASLDQFATGERRILKVIRVKAKTAAERWSRRLWQWTLLFGGLIFTVESFNAILTGYFPVDEQSGAAAELWHMINLVAKRTVAFAYGGLGACAYLLRSAHKYVQARTFDPTFIPEYGNRLLLGMIAGGTIELLATQLSTHGALAQLSAAALAFVMGYNADLLFRVIERVSVALLPKADAAETRKAESTNVSVERLITTAGEATDPKFKEQVMELVTWITKKP